MASKLSFASTRYRPTKLLGQGGMGRVLLAEDLELQRQVAIKIMSAKLRENAHAFARFRREARVQGRIEHPNVLKIHAWDLDAEEPYLVMEVVRGGSLSDVLGRGVLDLEAMLRLAREVASGLDHMHSLGLLHRDLKPDNIMLREDGSAVIMDLGLAKAQDMTVLTQTGAMLGTPRYFPPELFHGKTWTAASDQFQLGAILFRAITGENLVQGESMQQVAMTLATGAWLPFPARDPPLPASVRAGILQAVSPDPEQRHPTCTAMVRTMEDDALGEEAVPFVPTLEQVGDVDLMALPAFQPAPPGPLARAAPWVAGALVLGVGLALGFTSGGGRPDAAAAPLAPLPRGAANPLGSGFVAAAEDEFQALSKLRIEGQEVLAGAEAGRGEPLFAVPRDPALVVALGPHLPAWARFRDWVAAGNDPATMPVEDLAKLRELDKDYQGRGLERVYFPALATAPEAGASVVPGDLPWPPAFPRPERAPGWMGQALREFQGLLRATEALHADLRAWDDERPSEFPQLELMKLQREAALFKAKRFAREPLYPRNIPPFLAEPVGRVALAPWARAASDQCRAMVFAMGRATRLQPEAAEVLPHLLLKAYEDLRLAWASPAWALPLEFHLGGPLDTPDRRLLGMAVLLDQSESNLHSKFRPRLADEVVELATPVLALPGPGLADRRRRALALAMAYRLLCILVPDTARIPALFERWGAVLEQAPDAFKVDMLASLSLIPPPGFRRQAAGEAFAARLQPELRRHRAALPDFPPKSHEAGLVNAIDKRLASDP